MAKKKPAAKKESSVTFEDSIGKIRKIVSHLESGDATLAESLDDYEKGIAELKRCHAILDAAEQQISVLSGFDADGNPVTEPLPEMQVRTGAGAKSGLEIAATGIQRRAFLARIASARLTFTRRTFAPYPPICSL